MCEQEFYHDRLHPNLPERSSAAQPNRLQLHGPGGGKVI